MRARAAPLLIVVVLASSSAGAAPPVVIDDQLDVLVIGRHLDYLEDPEGGLSFADVSDGAAASRFRTCEDEQNNFGYTRSAYWLRFTTQNVRSGESAWYLEVAYPMLDRVQFYSPGPVGGYRVRSAGDAVPFASREIEHRTMVFPVLELPGTHTYYLRVQTTSPMNLPVSILSPSAFEERSDHELLFLWMFYGLMLGLAIYNLFIFFSVGDRSYLYYVAHIASFGMFMFVHNGLAYQYLWPQATVWASEALAFFGAMTALTTVQFARSFLGTGRTAPRIDQAFVAFLAFAAVMAPLAFAGIQGLVFRVGTVMSILMMISVLAAGVHLLRRGQRSARWYVAAWSAFAVGVVIALLKALGLLPIHFVTQWGYQIAAAVEALLLSLALADRINGLQSELSKLNLALESKVEDRTRSLTAANLQLAETNRRIEREARDRKRVQAQADQLEEQLRQSHKLEAAGRLAGEVARDMRQALDRITIGAFKLQEVGEAGDPGRVAVEILAGAQKGRDLTSTLLRFAQDEQLDVRRLSLNEIVARVGNSQRRSAPARMAVEMRLESDLAEVMGDPDQLEQAVTGLVRNAVEAMGEEGNLTLITENAAMSRGSLAPYPDLKPGMYVRFQVVDTGVGMGPQTLQQAFEPFFTTRRDVSGAGLGLALVYGTVRQHGGFVSLVSQPGIGTTATVCLPAIEDAPATD